MGDLLVGHAVEMRECNKGKNLVAGEVERRGNVLNTNDFKG